MIREVTRELIWDIGMKRLGRKLLELNIVYSKTMKTFFILLCGILTRLYYLSNVSQHQRGTNLCGILKEFLYTRNDNLYVY